MSFEFESVGPATSPEVIAEFENSLVSSLPEDYRTFLLSVNGGSAADDYHHPPSGPGDVGLRSLFGVGTDNESRSMEHYLEVYSGRYPAEFLPIGRDAGGNLILIYLGSGDFGSIYFWDHDWEAEEDEPPTYRNLKRISESFTAFLEELEPYRLPADLAARIEQLRRQKGLDT